LGLSSKVHETAGKVKAFNPELLREEVLFVLDAICGGIGPGERE
jgi:hypothetical protein